MITPRYISCVSVSCVNSSCFSSLKLSQTCIYLLQSPYRDKRPPNTGH